MKWMHTKHVSILFFCKRPANDVYLLLSIDNTYIGITLWYNRSCLAIDHNGVINGKL